LPVASSKLSGAVTPKITAARTMASDIQKTFEILRIECSLLNKIKRMNSHTTVIVTFKKIP
jgi:hypothetical protein